MVGIHFDKSAFKTSFKFTLHILYV